MANEELVQKIIENVGSINNIDSAINCATRLRIQVKDDSKVNDDNLKKIDGVLGLVHNQANYVEVVIGPGKVEKCGEICIQMGIPTDKEEISTTNDWKENKEKLNSKIKYSRIKEGLKTIGEIFIPLIPGVIAAGLCSGLSTLIPQIWPEYNNDDFLFTVWNILTLINTSFLTYITAWAGYRAAEKFGGTPILGGMIGMATALPNIDKISEVLGLYNDTQPLNSILRTGRGGVLAVIIGVYIMVKIEKAISDRIPDSLDLVFTPLLTLFITLIPYIFVIMPLSGFISKGICDAIGAACSSNSLLVRIIVGYLASSLFLPLVAMGMHHGLIALFSIQLEEIGYVTLYPALAMAGAGQVGAALAIYLKAKKYKNTHMEKVIRGSIAAGFLGVGEPLIYGVTIPLGKPFITAGLGAGFGGAFVMALEVGAKAWGCSGLLATIMMTGGPHGTISFVYYLIGLIISYVMGFIITNIVISEKDVENV